jgi:hypothetical protein
VTAPDTGWEGREHGRIVEDQTAGRGGLDAIWWWSGRRQMARWT